MVPGSRIDLANSGVGMAVKAGAPRPDISSSEAVRKALLSATTVAYSTGTSGIYVQRLFDRLGIAEQMKAKSKQTTPGVRVAQYLASGEADLGFQQVSELVHETGIDFLGPLPADIQNVTIYSSGVPPGRLKRRGSRQGAAEIPVCAGRSARVPEERHGAKPVVREQGGTGASTGLSLQ